MTKTPSHIRQARNTFQFTNGKKKRKKTEEYFRVACDVLVTEDNGIRICSITAPLDRK